MTKEQVILAYQKKYGHIPDLLARIVTQLDYDFWLSKPNYGYLDRFAAWNETVEGHKFWMSVSETEILNRKGLTESTFNAVASKYRVPVPPREKAKGIIELAERKQVFEALKTLVELDAQDGGERVMAASEMQLVDLNDDTTQLSIVVDKQVGRELEKDSKRLLILLFDAAEYDKVDNDGL